jgi:Na+/melibiose symporter-like transporter
MTMELNETIMRVYVIGGLVVALFLTLILVKLIEGEHRPKDLTVLWVILVIGIILVVFTWPFFLVLVLGMGAYVYLR